MWFFGLIVGAVLGYLFKPQIDKGVQKVVRMIKDNRSNKGGPTY
jgi:uncharacterized membrane protein YqgA involved in biofilm formation